MIRAFILARAASDREGLRSRLASPDLAVVGAGASLDDMRSSRPDVVVLADESLAGPRGSTRAPGGVWSDDPNAPARVGGWASGAWGLVGRPVASGLCVMRADVIPARLQGDARPLEQDAREEDEFAAAEPLTPRERDVLDLASRGLSNREIGAALGISEHTVKFHLAGIFGKLGVSTRTAAVRRGLRQRIIAI